ncbi:MAG TPA: winged helix-turn-helix domain-containing protein, partial [Pseudonocardiaceae bacterium]
MEFRLLGPVGVWQDGRPAWAGGRRERTMLAVLLLAAGRVVPASRLVDVVWGEAPPATARGQVHSGISVLRRVLRGRLVTRDPGYLVQVAPGELDLTA